MRNVHKYIHKPLTECKNINAKCDERSGNFFSHSTFHISLGFTLAEVLITLGIIGLVAAMTIPTLMNVTQNLEYKTAYKQAYSDLSQALMLALNDSSLTPRTNGFDYTATESEIAAFKKAFKVSKECSTGLLNDCWADGDKVCIGCGGGPGLPDSSCSSFIDASGRSWAEYSSAENIYLVDTNGFKKPNKFGKDRWMFTLMDSNNTRVDEGLPTKVGIAYTGDILAPSIWCPSGSCYYHSWLYN